MGFVEMSRNLPRKEQLRHNLRRCHLLPTQGWHSHGAHGLRKDIGSPPRGRLPRKLINAWRGD